MVDRFMDGQVSFITTFSGLHFTPTDPKADHILIEDIAHALSLLCRGNGHVMHFYSVAQHSINCANEAKARGYSKKVQLACLLHDASEAYISDITRPVKALLNEYQIIEKRIQAMIWQKYICEQLTSEELQKVKAVDDAMLYYEMAELLGEKLFNLPPKIIRTPDINVEPFFDIKNRFLSVFHKLSGVVTNADQIADTTFFPDGEFLSVGIDGCKGGWASVAIHECGFEISWHKTIEEVCRVYSNAHSIIIDMPIGLIESPPDLRPDAELRGHLKGKASSVFPTPCRQAVHANNYTEAIVENKKCLGKSIPPLSYAIAPKMREIDLFLQKNPYWINKLVESHPEYCFALLNNGVPILVNKQTPEGAGARLSVIGKYYSECRAVLDAFKEKYGAKIKTDDIMDAICLAVIGAIGLRHGFVTIPAQPEKDNKGILMQMVGAKIPRGI